MDPLDVDAVIAVGGRRVEDQDPGRRDPASFGELLRFVRANRDEIDALINVREPTLMAGRWLEHNGGRHPQKEATRRMPVEDGVLPFAERLAIAHQFGEITDV